MKAHYGPLWGVTLYMFECVPSQTFERFSQYFCILDKSAKSPFSPYFWASFHPLTPLLMVSTKEGNFIKSQYEMLKLNMKCRISTFNEQSLKGIIAIV